MPLKEPSWWYGTDRRGIARLLAPISYGYGRIAAKRMRFARPYTSSIPVICIGNFTAGGTGKTPLTLMLADFLRELGHEPALLTRGYGGSLTGPHLVDVAQDNALRTGDEALLLARSAPTVVARDRAAGARFLEKMADTPTVILMDDGLQNPSLAKMLRIAVVDARRGVGNGQVIPAGPLRAPLADQLAIADAIVVNTGPATSGGEPEVPSNIATLFKLYRFEGPILRGVIVPRSNLDLLRGTPVLAFAGIGHPERFFETLRLGGVDVAETVSFKDHYVFDAGDAENLLQRAKQLGAQLVTTEKDHVRLLSYDDQRRELAAHTTPFQIALTMPNDDLTRLGSLVRQALAPDDSASESTNHAQLGS